MPARNGRRQMCLAWALLLRTCLRTGVPRTDRMPRALHSGILDARDSVSAQILALKTPPAIIVGHSEGAGLAQICAGAFVRTGHKPTAFYAFKPPRIARSQRPRPVGHTSGPHWPA